MCVYIYIYTSLSLDSIFGNLNSVDCLGDCLVKKIDDDDDDEEELKVLVFSFFIRRTHLVLISQTWCTMESNLGTKDQILLSPQK